ncbi:MAG: hypothetical protein KJ053_10275 [Dehalococcoidia bacterium]|nr:hypothetical protein [Dehalococcoidia bacterium]
MVEKVESGAANEGAVAADTLSPPFVAEKLYWCAGCGDLNPTTARQCPQCDTPSNPNTIVETVPATCPHCAGDRPFVPGQWFVDAQGQSLQSPEKYRGDCPHCAQSARSADEAKAALEKGQFPEWGTKSGKFYP